MKFPSLGFFNLPPRAHDEIEKSLDVCLQGDSRKAEIKKTFNHFMQGYHALLSSESQIVFIERMESLILPFSEDYEKMFAFLESKGSTGGIQFLNKMFQWILALNTARLLSTDGVLTYVTDTSVSKMGLMQAFICGIDVSARWGSKEQYQDLSEMLSRSIALLESSPGSPKDVFFSMIEPLQPVSTDSPLKEPYKTYWSVFVDVVAQIKHAPSSPKPLSFKT